MLAAAKLARSSSSCLVEKRTKNARTEAQVDAATRFSSHLDAMIRHITKAELSRVEIVELLSQESEKFHNIGLSRGEVL